MSAFPAATYTGLRANRPVEYDDPVEGRGQHFFYVLNQPNSGTPETGAIINFQQAMPGYVHILDKFKCSLSPMDTAKNQILAGLYSQDLQTLIWQFTFNMAELAGNPFYSYPLIMADPQWVLALSFQANGGIFPAEYIYFRHRYARAHI